MIQRMAIILSLLSLLTGCGGKAQPYSVDIQPEDFVAGVDNPYFPLVPGSKYLYEGQTDEGMERVEVTVLDETRSVMGVDAVVVRDVVYLDGVLVEDTLDWFAQDKDGNVWYLGEAVQNYENGQLKDSAGSWEAGVDGALPGIIMWADPAARLNETYRQEYYRGHAEDMARALSASESVTTPFGGFSAVVQTEDYTPLEPGLREHKFYAAGVGLVKSVNLNTGEEILLVAFGKE